MHHNERLVKVRIKRGFTTRKALHTQLLSLKKSQQYAISYNKLGNLEKGITEPNIQDIQLLCEALQMTADYYLLDDPAPMGRIMNTISNLSPKQKLKLLKFLDHMTSD